MTTELSETILSNLGGIEHNNLISILDIETNEFIQMPPSLYFEVNELKHSERLLVQINKCQYSV